MMHGRTGLAAKLLYNNKLKPALYIANNSDNYQLTNIHCE